MEGEHKTYLDTLKSIMIGLVEIDQECAVLDSLYREQSAKRINARIDETIGSLMLLKERVKAAHVAQYDKSKYKDLMKK